MNKTQILDSMYGDLFTASNKCLILRAIAKILNLL
jgi:hypothetical protein